MSCHTKKTILFHCQYVYGIGHFIRVLEIAKVLSKQFRVVIFNGGKPIENLIVPENIELIQIPAIYKEEDSPNLLSLDSTLTTDECFAQRWIVMNELLKTRKIDALITEHFPFGFLFKEEVLNLISKIKEYYPSCKIISSIRDIVESYQGGLQDELTCEILNNHYDALLIHGDERIIPLERTFPKKENIYIPMYYTGYVVRNIDCNNLYNIDMAVDIIVVSIGGGATGKELQEKTILAHLELKKCYNHRLIIFLGSYQPNIYRDLPDSVEVHPFSQSKYDAYLRCASLLVCMGGYNTVLEAISLNKQILVYQKSFSNNNEEQACRIKEFDHLNLLSILYVDDLDSETLVKKILDKVMNYQDDMDVSIDVMGAHKSLKILNGFLN